MIQVIGLMIGAYILFRVLELSVSKPAGGQRIVTVVFGILLFLFTSFCMLDLALTNAKP